MNSVRPTAPSQRIISFREFVLLSAMLMAITAMSIDTILPALPYIGSALRVADPNHAQYVVSFLFLGFTSGQILYGPFSDSFGRKPTIYAGFFFFILGSLLCLTAASFPMMLAGRLLQGFGAAAPRVVSISIARDLYVGRDMARVMSFVMAVFIFVPVIAPSIGEGILWIASWHWIFVLFIAMAVIAGAWVFFRLPETLHAEDKRPFAINAIWAGMKEVFKNKTTMIYTVCAGFVFAGLIGYISSVQQVFQDYFQVGKMFPLYFAVSALSIGAASLVNSAIVRRFGMHLLSFWALVAMIAASALFLVYCLSVPRVPLIAFMLYAPSLFFAVGLLFGNLNAMAMEPMGHQAGIASAVIGCISSAISVALGTIIGQSFNDTLIPLVTGFLVMSAASFLLLSYESRKNAKGIFAPKTA